MRISFTLFIFISLASTLAPISAQPDETLWRHRAMGIAYMEEDDFSNSIAQFEQAVALDPGSAVDAINLGKAYYHGERFDDAIASLTRGLELDPGNQIGLYNLGLVYKTMGRFEDALPCFEEIAEADQSDAAMLYNLGLALSNLGRGEEANPWYEKTVSLDPSHSSAVYRLLLFAAKNGEREKSRELQARFQELKRNEEQRPHDAVDEGVYFGPIDYDPPEDVAHLLAGRPFSMFRMEANEAWTKSLNDALGISSFQLLASLPDVYEQTTELILSSDESTVLALFDSNASLQTTQKLADQPYRICLAGDFDHDKAIDLLLVSDERVTLLKRNEEGSFSEQPLPLDDSDGASDAFWADYDHEGDLDLLLARPGGNLILQNNGDGSFSDVTQSIAGFESTPGLSITATDYDFDNDLDIITLSPDGELHLFSNQREVRYEQTAAATVAVDSGQRERARLITGDFIAGDEIEILALNQSGPALISVSENGKFSDPLKLQTPVEAIGDFDNNGRLDLIFDSDGALSLQTYMNSDESPSLSIVQHSHQISALAPLDLNWDGHLDLFAATDNGPVMFENLPLHENKSIVLKIRGEKNTHDGFGAKLHLKDALFRSYHEVQSPVTHLGVGPREKVDVLRITWPNGIFQNVIEAAAASPSIQAVSERPGYAGSCPFIYTWDGDEFVFISDALSTGPLGLYVGGGYFPPRPEEYIRIRGDQLNAVNGEYIIRVCEELREITYLDRLELLSASHPDALEIHVNERFTVPPFPEFKLYGMSEHARPIVRMVDNHGNDVTELVSENDYRYPRPFEMKTRYEGVSDEYWFELDLGDIEAGSTPMLFMTGYVDWPNSSVARALEQNQQLDFVMPYLQVVNEAGEWETVMNPMGFPAGKLKTIPLDLSGVFLSEDKRLRIVSTLMVHWDRIWIDPQPIIDGFVLKTHPLNQADFRYGGYSRMYDLAGVGPHWYDYSDRSDNQRWSFHTGNYTRHGDVMPLLAEFDDRYAIMAPGDEIDARFSASDAHFHETTYFLHLHGWVKDADTSTAYGETVAPLPFKAMTAYPYGEDESYPLSMESIEYLMEYNTRAITSPNEALKRPETWKANRPEPESQGVSLR